MPADRSILLGVLFVHRVGRSAEMGPTVWAHVSGDDDWAYTASAQPDAPRSTDLEALLEETAEALGGGHYSLSIERTFHRRDSLPTGRQIVTTQAV